MYSLYSIIYVDKVQMVTFPYNYFTHCAIYNQYNAMK